SGDSTITAVTRPSRTSIGPRRAASAGAAAGRLICRTTKATSHRSQCAFNELPPRETRRVALIAESDPRAAPRRPSLQFCARQPTVELAIELPPASRISPRTVLLLMNDAPMRVVPAA